jgi:anti-sigma regulatory factor (Ser/Thr protein kinase)
MILVERLDLVAREATLDVREEAWPSSETRWAAVAGPARALGLRLLRVRSGAESERIVTLEGAGVAPSWALLEHRAVGTATGVRYEARLAHRTDAYRGIPAYAELLLRAAGAPAPDVGLVRLATYELCVNAIEHGQPLSEQPTLELGFEVGPEAIVGWVRDRCALFDPVGFRPAAIERLVRDHERRGYGLRMVHRLVDSLQHAHDGQGNHVSFTKELTHEAAT